jgi:uncharacterized membrane protein
MPAFQFFKLYAATAAVFFALDLAWLGLVARGFYRAQMGHLMRADVQWGPALLFYGIYVVAIIVLCVRPGLEHGSLGRAVAMGALFGLAAYAAFDLTSLALLKDFPLAGALVDLAWGTTVTAVASGASYMIARALRLT